MSYTCIENKMKMDSSFYYLCVYILSCITIVIKENILAIIIIIIIINQQVYIFIFILFLLMEEVTSWIIKYI
jgi:hypothetical protein